MKRYTLAIILQLTFTVISTSLNAQKAELVSDINKQPTPVGSDPRSFAVIDDKLYFTASDNLYGHEMRIFDGENLEFVKDIYPGDYGSKPNYYTKYNGKIFFTASDKDHGSELWVYEEGTGAKLYMDVRPKKGVSSSPRGITVFKNMLCFGAYGGDNGFIHMIDSNGTLFTPIQYRPYINVYRFGADKQESQVFAKFKDKLYFDVPFSDYGSELVALKDSAQNYTYWDLYKGKSGSSPDDYIVYKDRLFFAARTVEEGREVMSISDSGIISIFDDLNPGIEDSNPRNFKILNDSLWFEAIDSTGEYKLFNYGGGNDYNNDHSLASDIGVEFKNIIASFKGNILYVQQVKMPYGFHKSEDSFDETDEYRHSKWSKMYIVKEYNPITKEKKTLYGGKFPLSIEFEHGFTIYKNQLVFCANNGQSGNEVWSYSGVGNPKLMIDIMKGSYGSNIKNITVYNNKLYFTANDGIHGQEIWEYDLVNPPHILKDINEGVVGSNPSELLVAGGKLCFLAEQNNSINLWVYNGEGEPQLISALHSDANFIWASTLRKANGNLLFSGSKTGNKSLLWKYDGKNSPKRFELMHGDAMSKYFTPDNYPYWETNAAAKRTFTTDELKKSFVDNDIESFNREAFSVADKKVVIGYSPKHGLEPWVYSNTELSELLMDIVPGSEGSYSGNMFNFNNTLCFTAYDSDNNNCLWKYNGSGKPTKAIVFSDYRDNNYFMHAVYNGKLYYSEYLGDIGDVIMVWDGIGKPKVYYDIDPEYSSATISAMFTANSLLYFVADDDNAGEELFMSDGIASPTIIDLYEGRYGSEPRNITFTDNGFVFIAEAGGNPQIWMCNDKNSVKQLTNFNRKYGYSNIFNITPIGNKLYFTADDGVKGHELWEVDLE